jgi:hypothetical protein
MRCVFTLSSIVTISKEKTRQLLLGYGMNNTKPKEKPGFRARTVFNKAYPVHAGSIDKGKSTKKNRTQSVISFEEGPAAGSVVVDYGGVNGFKLQL